MMSTQVTLWYSKFISLGEVSRSGITISYASSVCNFWGICIQFFIMATPVPFIDSNCVQKSLCLHILTGIWCWWSLGFSHLDKCVMVLPYSNGFCLAQHYLLRAWFFYTQWAQGAGRLRYGSWNWWVGSGDSQTFILESKEHMWRWWQGSELYLQRHTLAWWKHPECVAPAAIILHQGLMTDTWLG